MSVSKLSLAMTWRDWRAGELHFLLLALLLSVASLSAVGFFVDRLRAGFERDAHQLLAADLLLESQSPLAPSWRIEAQERGLRTADLVTFTSMAFAADPPTASGPKLVSVKAVSEAYPLRGRLQLKAPVEGGHAGGVADIAGLGGPAPGSAWVEPEFLQALGLKPGSRIKLGELDLRVEHVISKEPDRAMAAMRLAPRVMIASSDLAASQLLSAASQASYRLLIAGEASALLDFQTRSEARIKHEQLKGVTLQTLAAKGSEEGAMLQRAGQFMSLVSLLSALLAAVAVAMAARRFMLRHIDACAMLRCLGLTQNQVMRLYLQEFFLIGLSASAAGVLLGYGAHVSLIHWLGGLLSSQEGLPAATWRPAIQGLSLGLLLLIGFTLPAILQLRDVPHTRLLRQESDPPKPMALLSYGLGLLVFTGLLLWQTGDVHLGLASVVGFLLGAFAFAALAWLSLLGLKRLRTLFDKASWRFAINALQRRPAAVVAQVLALSLGLMALLLLTLVRADLLRSWEQQVPSDAPNYLLINIMPEQLPMVAERLQSLGKSADIYPSLRARLTAMNGRPLLAAAYADEWAKSLLSSELDLTAMRELPAASRVVAGTWTLDGEPAKAAAEISVEEEAAGPLGLKLEDRLRLEVAGQSFEAVITSLRKSDRRSRRPTFSLIVNEAAVRGMPYTLISALQVTEAGKPVIDGLVRDFPNLTALDFGALIEQLQARLAQLVLAIEFLFLFTLASGLMVLYAALLGSQDLRMREAALLRALGATAGQLSRAQWIEYLLLGSLAGLLAASGASAASWGLARFVLRLEWSFSPLLWLAGMAFGAACALLGGWLGLRNILSQAPLASLRQG